MEEIKINANNPELESWIEVPKGSDFPIQNIPFGIGKNELLVPKVCTRIGDMVIDLSALAQHGFYSGLGFDVDVFHQPNLNALIALGKEFWGVIRCRTSTIFQKDNDELQFDEMLKEEVLMPAEEAVMLLPIKIQDYTDFYSSIEHATNVGKMFRDPENALLPNWKHIPVGYHGRASSIVISGTEIHRPKGQVKGKDEAAPRFSASEKMDFELEMGFVCGTSTKLGDSISIDDAEDNIFGMMIFNDLSARDIQQWEYVPLGPFLGKNFGSVVSPWIVTMDALQPYKVQGPAQDPKPLDYLISEGAKNYDINLEVLIQPEGKKASSVCHSNFKYMYWNMAQQLAHHTVNGCNVNIGDLYASGTISGPDEGSYGSMLELSMNGNNPLKLDDGSTRSFIEDNDTMIMKAWCEKDNVRIGFGECITKLLPAK